MITILSRLLKVADIDVSSFLYLRFRSFQDDGIKDINVLVCTPSQIREHIKRAHYQAMKWLKSANPPAVFPGAASEQGIKASHDGTVYANASHQQFIQTPAINKHV